MDGLRLCFYAKELDLFFEVCCLRNGPNGVRNFSTNVVFVSNKEIFTRLSCRFDCSTMSLFLLASHRSMKRGLDTRQRTLAHSSTF